MGKYTRYRHLVFERSPGHVVTLERTLNAEDVWLHCQENALFERDATKMACVKHAKMI